MHIQVYVDLHFILHVIFSVLLLLIANRNFSQYIFCGLTTILNAVNIRANSSGRECQYFLFVTSETRCLCCSNTDIFSHYQSRFLKSVSVPYNKCGATSTLPDFFNLSLEVAWQMLFLNTRVL